MSKASEKNAPTSSPALKFRFPPIIGAEIIMSDVSEFPVLGFVVMSSPFFSDAWLESPFNPRKFACPDCASPIAASSFLENEFQLKLNSSRSFCETSRNLASISTCLTSL